RAAAPIAPGAPDTATSAREAALRLARSRRTALWYEPRILATLAEARMAAGDRSRARALLAEARELVEQGRGWRLSACDVVLAWVRLLGSEPGPDRAAVEGALPPLEAIAVGFDAEVYRRMTDIERARRGRWSP